MKYTEAEAKKYALAQHSDCAFAVIRRNDLGLDLSWQVKLWRNEECFEAKDPPRYTENYKADITLSITEMVETVFAVSCGDEKRGKGCCTAREYKEEGGGLYDEDALKEGVCVCHTYKEARIVLAVVDNLVESAEEAYNLLHKRVDLEDSRVSLLRVKKVLDDALNFRGEDDEY